MTTPEPTVSKETRRARYAERLHEAVAKLEGARHDLVMAANYDSDPYAVDLKYFISQIDEFLSSDSDEVGLHPFVRRVT
jgi:hypothetical protein